MAKKQDIRVVQKKLRDAHKAPHSKIREIVAEATDRGVTADEIFKTPPGAPDSMARARFSEFSV
jgi:hypothetical protein